MNISMLIYTMLIILCGAINSKLVESTDNMSNNKNKALEVAIKSDNMCNNHEKNVAVDVILIDNKPFHDEGILKNINKRQAPSDKRRDYKDRPRPDQKSLLIIFDGTGSMHDDLQQLRSGAQEIINDLAKRDDSPIFNYVLVVFRDPSVEPPFDTRNPNELMEKLSYINVSGGGDCPEMALSGLKIALQLALPNSFAYVFSDASSKDHHFYNEVVALIQKKQVTVNFLLTGDCNLQNNIGYKVYHDLSRVSNGQVYDMNKSNVKDVLLAIRDTVKHNYAALKSVDVEKAGRSNTGLTVDKSISELKVNIAGRNPQLSIRDPTNVIVKGNEELTLNNLKLVNIKDPKDGVWHIEAGADSSHSIRLSALSELKFEFGFSLSPVEKKSETAFQPLKGHKNVLSLFISDPSLIKDLSNVTIILVPASPSESARQFTIPLKKVTQNVYATKSFDVPNQMFKIQLNGLDANENSVERLISTGLISSLGSAPELNIEANQKEIYEGDRLQLKCTVKSHIPVHISWNFNGRILQQIYSNQSNELELVIQNVTRNNHGTYKCLAANSISKESDEININILTIPKVKITSNYDFMEEDKSYSLKCSIDDAKEQKIEISWIDDEGTILKNGSDILKFTPTHLQDQKTIKCRAQSKDFVIEDSFALNIHYSPRFISDGNDAEKAYIYGSKVTLDCTTMENPKRRSVQWFFTSQNLNSTQQVRNQSGSKLIIQELLEENEGFYGCVVMNDLGMAQKDFMVLLIPKDLPKINTKSDVLYVKESEDIELQCECKDCLPLINFTWTYDNDKSYEQYFIKNQEENFFKTIMKLVNVDETDNGTFHCIMWNALGEEKVTIELLVQTTPKIEGLILNNDEIELEVSENYELLEGKNFSVECVVDGFPEPTIFWRRNHEKISNDSLLIIENILTDDEGDYECIAENNLGVTKKGFHVDVNYPPRKKREVDTSYEVIEDKNVTLNCDLIGNPRPQISWQMNFRDIDLSDDKYESGDNFLKFMASSKDSGVYRCNGTNKFGEAFIDFSVIVMSSPQIMAPNDESIKLSTNSTLKLSCDSTGYPQPIVKFLKDNKIISNTSSFEISSVTPLDSGSYSCVAENQVATVEKIFYVSVVEKPTILSTFMNVTIMNNETHEVVCITSGIPEPTVTWRQDNRHLIDSSNVLVLNSSFESGIISCNARNSEGSDEKFFFLEVVRLPKILPIAENLEKSLQFKENDDMEILCPFENYDHIKWTFNGSSIRDIQHKQIEKELFVHNVNRAHDGLWTCTVSNQAGQDEFSYQVNILTSPTILPSWNLNDQISEFFYTESDIDEKVLKKGENLKLNCTASGSPMPKIQWRKGTDLIAEGEVLDINDLNFYHSDIYTCSAENSQGSVKKFFKVDVISEPYIDDSITTETQFQKMSGDSVILKCNGIIANPAPLYFWFKNNEILDDESDDHVIIENLDAENEGKYRCLAKNKYGSVKIEYEISIYQPAKIKAATADIKTDDSVELSCTTQGNPMPIISWTLNGHILSSTSKLNVNKLMKTATDDSIYFDGHGNGISFLDPFRLKMSDKKFYSKLTKIDFKTLQLNVIFKNKKSLHMNKFYCYSFNALGRDEKFVEIKINQKPYLESQGIPRQQDFEILEGMPLLLSCLIEGYPQPQITWFKNGLKIYENETVEFLKNQKFLRISDTFSWNSGNYSCMGKNEMGELTLQFKVLILSPPKIMTQPNANFLNDDKYRDSIDGNEETIDVLKGSNVILECSVEASPKAKVYWIKLNYHDLLSENEVIKTEESFLILNAVQEAMSFMCYANNTIGNIQKFFHISIQYPPIIIGSEKLEEHLAVKLHHSINLECKTKASPEASTYWTFNSTNLTKSANDYYFTTDNQIMRITNANRNHEGKYICISANKLGQVQKVFYIKINIPIQYSPWSEWSECSATCGSKGLQYRSRTCVLLDSVPSYNCSGENVQMRKCNDIPCPVNGGWGNWTEWSACPKCYDTSKNSKTKQKRFRKCDNPLPSYGGMKCVGSKEDERECKLSPCPIDGNWSEWSNWSVCSKTCGKGFRNRKRFCNNPTPMHNGKPCDGENYEYEECRLKPCNNNAMLRSMRNDYDDVSESTEHYGPEFEVKNDENGNPKVFQFMQRREMEYSAPLRDRGYKVKVTLDTYKPISEETYNNHLDSIRPHPNDDYLESDSYESTEATESLPNVSTEKNCGPGFKYNQIYRQCEEIDECKSRHMNTCRSNERCINTIGSYQCEKIF